MKKMRTAVALLGLSLPVMAQAMEFQTPGTLGMGRAGVARTTDAYATFINPAGLAFHEKGFSTKLNADVGLGVSSTLANNLDKIGKLNIDPDKLNYSTPADAAKATAAATQFADVLNSIDRDKGNLNLTVDLALGIQINSFGVGVLGITDVGAGVGPVDTTSVRIGSTTTTGAGTQNDAVIATLAADMAASFPNITAAATRPATTVFTDAQYQTIWQKFQTVGGGATKVSDQQAQVIASQLEAQFAAGGNPGGLTSAQLVDAVTTTANFIDPNNKPIGENTTKVLLRGLMVAEVPIAYGYKFDLGNFGKLGVGAAAKVMRGTVYSSDVEIFKIKDSKDAADRVKDNHAESTQVGLDLGALWRLEEVQYIGPINVGLALKNLNSPTFDGPVGYDKVKVEPQARLGLGLDPLSWLSIAADMDLTKNKTVVPGRDSQLIGGGLEAHFDNWYALWLALRAGVYKNIGETGSKPVLTAGLSLGPKYFRLDVNGAIATEKGTFDGKQVPLEGKVEFGLSTTFF